MKRGVLSSRGEGDDVDEDGLGEFSGWMLKAAPKMVDADKEASVSRQFRRAANHLLRSLQTNADFKRRFFVLDGSELRYYKDDQLERFLGSIDLGTVQQVQYADRAGLPAFAIDMVSYVLPLRVSQVCECIWYLAWGLTKPRFNFGFCKDTGSLLNPRTRHPISFSFCVVYLLYL